MPTYLYKLTPPRATFPSDMTPAEGAAMEQHFGYWGTQMKRGVALVFGPVADPKGAYGIAIVNAPDEAEAKRICSGDPAITARLGFKFEVNEMPNAVVRGADA